MHVAVVGMGALGRVYGVRLALRAATQVTFVLKPERRARPLRLERVDSDRAQESMEGPAVAHVIPREADVALVCVRVEQLDASFDALLTMSPDVPVVVMTPLLPAELARLVAVHGARIRVGMPGVVSYMRDEVTCRYWLPKVAPTLIDDALPVPAAVSELVRALAQAGFGARLERGVQETNPATTIAFIPLAMGVDAAGGIDALLADRELLAITLAAVSEGISIASKVGTTPSWVSMLTRFASPLTLKLGLGVVRSRSPEALAYVEDHFGRKLHAQNVAMAVAIVALGRGEGSKVESLTRLSARLVRVA